MMNYDNAMTDNENFAIQIVVDNECLLQYTKNIIKSTVIARFVV